ncbi:MAG: hypothetical protein GXO71_00815 [Caldiserica bacterium]|nr:hypothetical protein [Caldisericota bacterium]
MEYRVLGRTGLKVSVVGIGTLGFGREGLFPKGEAGIKEMARVINRALDLGVNIIDTACAYGNGMAEKGVGEVMKKRRNELIVLSRTHAWQKSDNPADIAVSLEESLNRLQVDTIDIYQLHDVTSPEAYRKVMEGGFYEVLRKAKKEGKVRFIGFSTHGSFEVVKKMIESGEVDVLTLAYNILHRKRVASDGEDLKVTSQKVFPLIEKFGIGLTVMKPLGGGALTLKGADGRGLSPLKLVRYVVQNQYVHTVTPGVGTISHLEELVKAGDDEYALTPEEIKQFEEEAKRWGRDLCRQCGYCLPCPQDIPIPSIMRLLTKWQQKRDRELMKSYKDLETKASACVECRECEKRCPYDIRITGKMREARQIFE